MGLVSRFMTRPPAVRMPVLAPAATIIGRTEHRMRETAVHRVQAMTTVLSNIVPSPSGTDELVHQDASG